jgi:hypothetical protein
MHNFIQYYVGLSCVIAAFYHVLYMFVLRPTLVWYLQKYGKTKDGKTEYDDIKLKTAKAGCGFLLFHVMVLIASIIYCCWLVSLLFIPSCICYAIFIFAMSMISYGIGLQYGPLSKSMSIASYVNTGLSLITIALMFYNVVKF